MEKLNDVKVAILTEAGFEQVELTSPKEALQNAGVTVHVVSPHTGTIKAWDKKDWGIDVPVDKPLNEANAEDYDAIMLPGGVLNPDKLRTNKDAIKFVQHFIQAGKPIFAICHGPQTLIETGFISGKTMTSFPSLQTDLKNAGANWVDKEVVCDGNLVTSRKPDDLEAFNKQIIQVLSLQES